MRAGHLTAITLLFIGISACTPTPTDTDTDTGGLSDQCLFGDTSTELMASELVEVALVANYTSHTELPELTGQQFWVAMVLEDLTDLENLEEAFSYTDDGLTEYDVLAHHSQARFAWLKWWAGDTEVGYLFAAGTVDVVAVVSDGDIRDCTVMAPL